MPETQPRERTKVSLSTVAAIGTGAVAGLELGKHYAYPKYVFDDEYKNHQLNDQIGEVEHGIQTTEARIRQLKSVAPIVKAAGQSTVGIDRTIAIQHTELTNAEVEKHALVSQKSPEIPLAIKSGLSIEGVALAGALLFGVVKANNKRWRRSLQALDSDRPKNTQ